MQVGPHCRGAIDSPLFLVQHVMNEVEWLVGNRYLVRNPGTPSAAPPSATRRRQSGSVCVRTTPIDAGQKLLLGGFHPNR